MQKTLDQFMNDLAYGQLKNTSAIDDSDTGEINPAHEDQFLSLMNKGLIDITTKKKIFTATEVVTFITGTNAYTLNDPVAESLMVNVLEIQAVKTGLEVIDRNKEVFTTKTKKYITMSGINTIEFTDTFMENYGPSVDVVKHMVHPTVTAAAPNISLPPNMFELLELYVAGLYLTHMGTEDSKRQGDAYYGLYLKMMTDDEITNSSNTSEVTDEDTRFSDRGFV